MLRRIQIPFAAVFFSIAGFASAQEIAGNLENPESYTPREPVEYAPVAASKQEEDEDEKADAPLDGSFAAMSNGPLHVPVYEWERRVQVEERLRTYGPDLLGDQIDPHFGGISFEHTDVSVPGNSALEVAVRRRRQQGIFYAEQESVEFADWQIIVPRIHALTLSHPWTADRCTGSNFSNFPDVIGHFSYVNGEYTQGPTLDVPGAGQTPLLEQPQGAQWPAGRSHVTTDNWWFECGTANDGGEGFIGHAPNGDTYYFDTYYTVTADAVGVWGSDYRLRQRNILAASEVRDVHGNWVKYNYDANGRLTKIYSNDGRQIDLTYSGASKLISTVQANGRTWTYGYGNTNYSEIYEIGYYNPGMQPMQVLRSVTQPDGRAWSFQLDGMIAKAGPGAACVQAARTLTVTHPYGVTGTFNLVEQTHRQNESAGGREIQACPNDRDITSGEILPEIKPFTTIDAMSVTAKTLSGPNIPTSTWTYDYENDRSNITGIDPTNWTKVQGPDGTHITYYHNWSSYAPPPGDYAAGGKLVERQVREGNAAGALIETTIHDYELEASLGATLARFGPSPATIQQPAREILTTIWRGADYFRTRNYFDSDYSSSTYSFGAPIKVDTWSSTSGHSANKRTTDMAYVHRTSTWVLSLPTSITRNGVTFDQHGYDSRGRRVWTYRFGAPWRTFTYHTTGAQAGLLNTVEDAVNRTTTLNNFKRGEPQTITRADGVNLYMTIDNNGWLTSETDANGNITNYQYNNMGWLTRIDRPGAWSDTVIDYQNVGLWHFYQRTTRGNHETVVWMDELFRPWRTRTRPLTWGLTTYVETDHDIHGRETFRSFPSTSTGNVDGVETTYDALGRVTETRENVAPYSTTGIEYIDGDRVRTTDPSGAKTNVYTRGYGQPEDGGVFRIVQWDDVTTEITRDIYGNMTEVRQHGAHNGYAVDHTQKYYYDAKQRLCRHSVPETGDTLYTYNAAYEMTGLSRGQAAGATCGGLNPAETIYHTYDAVGRVDFVNYPSGTADIDYGYDNNGNVTSVNRSSGVNWTYAYNELDLLEDETLVIDGRTYVTDYGYNDDAALLYQISPGGRSVNVAPNGLGQPTRARIAGFNHVSGGTYHPSGGLLTLDYANGQSLVNDYYPRQLLKSTKVQKAGAYAVWFAYSYDDNGRIDAINDGAVAGQNRTFGYDHVGRLVSATGPWGTGSFTYDSLGNIREKKLGSRTVSFQYDATSAFGGTGRLTSVKDTGGDNAWRALTYDAKGNTLWHGLGLRTLAYDAAEQPTSIVGNGVSGVFVYDGNLKRVKQLVNGETVYSVYGQSGALLYRDNATTGVATDYVRMGGMTVARIKDDGVTETVSYLHQNHLGSPVAATDTGGTVLWREDYTPFGEERQDPAANDNDENFTGHIRDEATGLIYAQARYMDPVIGRFLSNDPVAFSPDQPQMFNRYSYVYNDPVNVTDPDGRCPWCLVGAVVGAISEGVAIANDVRNGRDVSLAEGALRVAGSAAIGAVGGGAGAVLAKGVAQVGAKAAVAVATKVAGNAAIGGAANGSNTALRREIQVGVTGSSDITNSDVRTDIALGAAAGAAGTLVGEAVEGAARAVSGVGLGPKGDLSPLGAAAGQTANAAANIAIVNPGTFESGNQPPPQPTCQPETNC